MVDEGGEGGAERQGPGGLGHGEADDAAAAAEDGPADGVAFGLVGVEESGVRVAAQDGGELPAEVRGVLETGVHALPAGRGVDVGGVPGQEDPAHPVRGGLALVAVEAGHPASLAHAVVAAEREPGDLPDLVEIERLAVGDVTTAVPADDPVVAVAEGGDEGEGVTDGVRGQHLGGFSSSRTSARTTERMTDLPGNGNPIASRTALRCPSVPTTYAAVSRSVPRPPSARGP